MPFKRFSDIRKAIPSITEKVLIQAPETCSTPWRYGRRKTVKRPARRSAGTCRIFRGKPAPSRLRLSTFGIGLVCLVVLIFIISFQEIVLIIIRFRLGLRFIYGSSRGLTLSLLDSPLLLRCFFNCHDVTFCYLYRHKNAAVYIKLCILVCGHLEKTSLIQTRAVSV